MKINATHLRICVASAILLGAVTQPEAVLAQDRNPVVTDRNPDMRDIAVTPIQDLNLTKDEIPEALRDAVIAPYASEKMATCDTIRIEVQRLDRVLGDDLDIATGERRDITVGKVAKSVVGSLIPFRGVIREITGAADHQRDFQEAILAGVLRRGFLKGLGQERGCPYPARPAFTRVRVSDSDTVAAEYPAQPEHASEAQSVPTAETTFVSRPVVQKIDD